MRARELQKGQVFYSILFGAAISPYLTVCDIKVSDDGKVVTIVLPNGKQKDLKANQRVRLAAPK